ncbi:type I polyketide synthase [Rhizobacter sp. SG703]|uniref:type I polyketide synthase n=1 Tax=Rhizobacter sp. SG703 TaxID=2587140 RepID=UPI0014482541|nr:type I polyketide synthase [Rhizobacter sp. SG703]NKI93273.1 acyl transferase domain-containing protein/predicted O-methyltransferase YrrM [Rhizobacter sp. SG703]
MSDFLERISHFSPKRLALLADELQQRVQELEGAAHQPIAIVGIGCRFPGGADTPEKFWVLVRDGVDAVTEVPAERWSIDDWYHPDPDHPGTMNTRFGGFVGPVDGFDAHFFGVSPREALSMDPQQRLLLEVAWQALEHAGINPERVAGSRTGVFVGMSAGDYWQLLREGGVDSYDAYTASGIAHSIASGRLSYVLGARGPSVSVDTACSSSMVAIHQAVHSLRRGECDQALAGGVNLVLSPEITVALSRSHMMAPDGRCKAFDARADGFVRGEGCGLLVLKRLADAQADGDTVIALIRGSAANQDGRSNGLTAPNGPSQEAVLRDALADARVLPAEVGVVEAHGTGTSLGDPIEVQALGAVMGEGRAAEAPLLLGSVKANVGHLEAAAGVAAVIKMALALQHGQVPGQIHLQQPNPFIPWDELPVRVPTALGPWPAQAQRIGGVSSFGFSGTNVHLVMAQAPDVEPVVPNSRPLQLLSFSARQPAALRELVQQHLPLLTAGASLADLAFSANTGRARFAQRLAVSAATPAEARERLSAWLAGDDVPGVAAGTAPARAPKLAFLFTGQGAQSTGMARGLYDGEPVFRAALDRCAAGLQLPMPLLDVLFTDGAPLDDTAFTQPALFAVEYALATLWQSWGVQPQAVMGHSVGEFVAACIAGVFSLEDALRLVSERGRLMGALPRNGAMLSVMASEARIADLLAPWRREVSVAAVNGPDNVVISGLAMAVDALATQLQAAGLAVTRLKVSHAFHSPLMAPMLDEFERVAEGIAYGAPRIDLVSNVTGRPIGAEVATARYWREHVMAAVQFAPAMQALADGGCELFVEIGPHPTLLGLGRACLPERGTWLPSLRRGKDDLAQMLDSLGQLFVQGVAIDWAAFDAGRGARRVALPSYPFQRERYWPAFASTATPPPAMAAVAEDTGLAPRVQNMLHEIVWRDAERPALQPLAPAQLAAHVLPRVDAIAAQNGLDAYADFMVGLHRLAAAYVVRALRLLGCGFAPATAIAPTRFDTLPAHARLVQRMLAILAEDGILVRDGSTFVVRRTPDDSDPEDLADELLARHPQGEAELLLTRRCGRELAAVLRGRVDPLALLFPGGSLDDTERLYRNSPPAKTYNSVIAETVQALVAAWPADRPLRVLEIGAGTGSTTSYVLPALPAQGGVRVDYTFTDVSPLFLNRAREKFAAHGFMRYELLDIGRAPTEQGFSAGGYDLVLGANVLHATPDLDVTIRHVRQLLAPGGVLVLLEGTTPQRFGDLTVGLLDGWWAWTDTQRRSYALMPREGWTALLSQHGLQDPTPLPGATTHPVLAQQAVFVAQAPVAVAEREPSRWLVLADRAGFADALLAELRRAGDLPELVAPTADALAQALRGPLPCRGVVQLQALDLVAHAGLSTDDIARDQQFVVGTLLQTVQTMAAQSGATRPALWIATRGAQATHRHDGANPAQATAWGMAHVVAIEHPELQCTRIDLDPSADAATAAVALVAELQSASREDQLALRGSRRLARRLVRHEAHPSHGSLAIDASRSYLITGGLRGLGLRVAEWLATQGARRLVLMGRRAADERVQRVIDQLRAQGVDVQLALGDVARRDDVQRVLAGLTAPLAGVIHAAGVLDDGVIAGQTWPRFETVMGPKVFGSWNLHTLCGELDFMVFFSSGASVAGSPGQVNHAAANAFEDALAWHRQAQGLPTLSINWGPWAEIGAAADRRLEQPGSLQPIAPADGLAALDHAMRRDGARSPFETAQIAVLASDWAHLREQRAAGTQPPLFSELAVAEAAAGSSPSKPVQAVPSLHERMAAALPARRKTVLRDEVRRLTVKVLGVQRADELDVTEPLRQLGLDSLMAVELRNLLGKSVGRTLAATVTFDHPSVAALTEHLASEVFADQFSEPVVAAPSTPAFPPADSLDALSEDELAMQLMRRLDGIGAQETS